MLTTEGRDEPLIVFGRANEKGQMADGKGQMAKGRWQRADGKGQMAKGRWQRADDLRFSAGLSYVMFH
jgi:hypothetical protein